MTTERFGVTIPNRTVPYSRLPDYAKRAEAAGFHSAWDYHMWRDPYCMLTLWAEHTERVRLGSLIAMAFGRSPMETACAIHDVDELSDGRAILGLGQGVSHVLEAFHSVDLDKPIGRMSEYIDVLRLAWQFLKTAEAESYQGKHYRFTPPPYSYYDVKEFGRQRIPIYLAGLGPQMLSLVGRKADGWAGYLATPRFIEECVIPGIAAGADKAGRSMDDIDIASAVITSVSSDRDVAMHRGRLHVGTYLAHPSSDAVVKMHGLEQEQLELRTMIMTEGPTALAKTPDKLVEAFSITGTPEEARQRLDAYSNLKHVVLHVPYIPPLTWEESEDAYFQLLDAFGDIATAARDAHMTAAA